MFIFSYFKIDCLVGKFLEFPVVDMRITNRQVWQNEYMLMLALDDIIPRCIEEQKKDLERNDGLVYPGDDYRPMQMWEINILMLF